LYVHEFDFCCRKGVGVGGLPPRSHTTTLFPVDISFEDDVTVIPLLGVSFTVAFQYFSRNLAMCSQLGFLFFFTFSLEVKKIKD
jgi:hypothetical protein